MKRYGNLYSEITNLNNLYLADEKARRGKKHRKEIIAHDKFRMSNLRQLQRKLRNKTFTTSRYSTFKVFEPKERLIYKLPYFPDRIIHHAIVNVLEPIWNEIFTSDTYSCVKGRGIHSCSKKLKESLHQDPEGTSYCLQLDIKKYYPSIDHNVMMEIIKKKIKCTDTLWLIEDIVCSEKGLPIGNYLSQHLSNLYLTYFDHFVKEVLGVKYYFRYADDIIVLHSDKQRLWHYFYNIQEYLNNVLELTIKNNYKVFPTSTGIDFVGYVHYPTHTLLRKSIKKRMAKAAKKGNPQSIASYWGWAKHCDSKNLINKLNIQL